MFGCELVEHAVHDRARGFSPRSGAAARPSVGITPAQQVELAGEGDAGPTHALVANGFADRDHVRLAACLEVVPEIAEPNRRCLGHIVRTDLTELVEGGADGGLRQVRQQRVDRG